MRTDHRHVIDMLGLPRLPQTTTGPNPVLRCDGHQASERPMARTILSCLGLGFAAAAATGATAALGHYTGPEAAAAAAALGGLAGNQLTYLQDAAPPRRQTLAGRPLRHRRKPPRRQCPPPRSTPRLTRSARSVRQD